MPMWLRDFLQSAAITAACQVMAAAWRKDAFRILKWVMSRRGSWSVLGCPVLHGRAECHVVPQRGHGHSLAACLVFASCAIGAFVWARETCVPW